MSKDGTWAKRNPEAFNAAWRRWYRANADRKIEWQMRRRREIRQWFVEFKAAKQCEQCGEASPECLHFHHVDPTRKEISVAQAVARAWSRERILKEVAKCRVLCANCHFKLHWDERLVL
jgi:hypothetical protein